MAGEEIKKRYKIDIRGGEEERKERKGGGEQVKRKRNKGKQGSS